LPCSSPAPILLMMSFILFFNHIVRHCEDSESFRRTKQSQTRSPRPSASR